jgi:hypothetical protein
MKSVMGGSPCFSCGGGQTHIQRLTTALRRVFIHSKRYYQKKQGETGKSNDFLAVRSATAKTFSLNLG